MNNKFTLDNAAKIYPAAMTKDWNAVFRTSVYLNETVNRAVLAQAVIDLAPRFPSFYVQLHEGVLWDSFVPALNHDIVMRDMYGICKPFPVGRGSKPLFRVLYKDNAISAEFFHAVTDGNGALVYLKTLTAHYLELQGAEIEKTNGVLDINEAPKKEELEDAFQNVYEKAKRVSRNESNAYQYRPEREQNYLRAVSAIIPIDEVKAIAREYDCTVTAYLAGVYAFAFLQNYKKEFAGRKMKRNVKISIPVNLRSYFDAATLRNFASYVNVSIDSNRTETLEDAVWQVKAEMERLIQIEKIQKTVSQNVAEEKMIISKLSPNKLKKLVMKACFMLLGERKYTSPLSNLGMVKVPKSMEKYVERFEFIIGEMPVNSIYCAAAGFKNNLTVTLSTVSTEATIENLFFEALKLDGINFKTEEICKRKAPVRMHTNDNQADLKKSLTA